MFELVWQVLLIGRYSLPLGREKCSPWNNKGDSLGTEPSGGRNMHTGRGLIRIPDPILPTVPMFSLSFLIKQGWWLHGHKAAEKALHSMALPCCCTPWLGWVCLGKCQGQANACHLSPTTGLDLVWSVWRHSFRGVWEVFILSFHPWCELDIGKRIFRGRRECVRTHFGVACKENSSVAFAFLLKEERNREKQKRKTHPGNPRFNTSQGRICGAADL